MLLLLFFGRNFELLLFGSFSSPLNIPLAIKPKWGTYSLRAMSFFANLHQSFVEVPENGRIETKTFLDASLSMLAVLDLLGPGAFSKIKSFMTENATKLKEKYESDTDKFKELQCFVETEKETGNTKDKKSATSSLLLLKRGLTFIKSIFEEVLTMHPNLGESVSKAYEKSLKKYHGWLIQKMFGLALRGVTTREKFFESLGNGATEEVVIKEMQTHFDVLSKNIGVIDEFYEKMGEERHDKV